LLAGVGVVQQPLNLGGMAIKAPPLFPQFERQQQVFRNSQPMGFIDRQAELNY